MSTHDRAPHGRGMAWATLLVAGGISLGVNLWHAFDQASDRGPVTLWLGALAVMYGTAPVILAAFQAHSAAFTPKGWFRLTLTYVLMLLGMALSIRAQAAAVEPFAGDGWRWVFPVMVDLSTIEALITLVISARRTAVVAQARTADVPVRTVRPVICERKVGMPSVRKARPVLRAVRDEPYGLERTDGGVRTDAVRAGRTEACTAPRTDAVSSARTTRTEQVSAPVRDVREGRAYWVGMLAKEIRTATVEGRTWEPVYADLEVRTGWGRSWCEKTVRAARTAAEIETDGEGASRTGTDA
ncbi:hypothetical protein GCM10022254_09500 [Actinomadura meridiana]|uniref:DUF2637 domain-containing protein n=1 Tax=Actinomadura meridiana TaxID=559626 RepID=A0ABP8BTR3_9ACTN